MAIAPLLQPGLEAYRRGDVHGARLAWQAVAQGIDTPAERALLLALQELAGALQAHRDREPEVARRRFAEAEATLGALPDDVLGVDVLALRAELARGLAAAARSAPALRPHTRFPLGPTLRFLSLLLLLAAGVLLIKFTPLGHYLERQRLIGFFTRVQASPWAPVVLIGLCILAGPIGLPMTPFILAGGIVFGNFWGALYNTLGCVLSAAVSFQLARLLGRDFVRRVAGKRLKRIETLLRRRGFWSLVGIRLLPVPFPIVNYGAALAGVRFSTFVITSALGIAPAMVIYTYFASTLFESFKARDPSQLGKIGIAFVLVVAMSVTPTIIQQVRRRKRYRDLVVERHATRQKRAQATRA